MNFKVLDKNTGKEADIYEIALKEDWAKDLIYCDMEGFAINEDGHLILLDECGNFAYCPSERFTILYENAIVLSREEYNAVLTEQKRLKEVVDRIPCGYSLTEQTRKETAKEILEAFENRVSLYYPNGLIPYSFFQTVFEQIAKQHGVEVEE